MSTKRPRLCNGLKQETCEGRGDRDLAWLPSIVKLIQSEIQSISTVIMNGKTWPPYSPVTSLCRRVVDSFPSTLPSFIEDTSWVIRGHVLRLAIAFTIASIPIVTIKESVNAHWFPMTVALIMLPGQGRA